MNIFVLDKNPVKAAEYHCNKHVVKMILEAGQMLCAAHWLHLFKNYYKGEITDFKRSIGFFLLMSLPLNKTIFWLRSKPNSFLN